jgi:capsular polysaccharide biosynthesis protein
MSEQALDLKRSLQIVRRHLLSVCIVAVIGLILGASYTVLKPPMYSSTALVVLPNPRGGIATQAVVAGSPAVLGGALPAIRPSVTLDALEKRITVKSLAADVISVSAEGPTGASAQLAANAVARSYVSYIQTANTVISSTQAKLLNGATTPTRPSVPFHIATTAALGGLAGAILAAIAALAFGRTARRLRRRDDLADALGVPVLASLSVWHPTNAAHWSRLFELYKPGTSDAWRLRNALKYLSVADAVERGGSYSLAVLSFASDRRSLAIGPQLAVYAASLGIPAVLVIGPQQDAKATASLRAACAAAHASPSHPNLRIEVADRGGVQKQPQTLTVIVTVVDHRNPRIPDTLLANAALLGVSPGTATGEHLAQVAASAAASGCQIDGIVVADPDSADPTTGRIPHMVRSTHRKQPTRLTGMRTESRRRPTETLR